MIFFLQRNKRLHSAPTFWNYGKYNGKCTNSWSIVFNFFRSLSLKSSTNFGTISLILSIAEESKKITQWKNDGECKGKNHLNPFLVCYHETPRKNLLEMDVVDITLLGHAQFRGEFQYQAWPAKPQMACKRERTHNSVRRCWHKSSRVFRGFWNDFAEVKKCLSTVVLDRWCVVSERR